MNIKNLYGYNLNIVLESQFTVSLLIKRILAQEIVFEIPSYITQDIEYISNDCACICTQYVYDGFTPR